MGLGRGHAGSSASLTLSAEGTSRDGSHENSRDERRIAQRFCAGFHFSFRPKTVYKLLKATYHEWSKYKVPRMGAALAYYTIFSLAPLLVIAISVAGIAFGDEAVQGEIVGQIQGVIGLGAARAIQTMIQSAHKPGNQIFASILGLVVLFIGASGVFNEMQDNLNEIWGVDTTAKTGIWNLIKARFLSFGMVLGIGFLLLVSLVLSAFLAGVTKYVSGFLPVPEAVLHLGDMLFSIFFITVLFAMIFRILPDVRIPWSDVWVGAGMTAILFTIGKFLIGFYIGKSVTASAYGAAGSLVVIVAWIYYCAQLLYFGAEFTKVYATACGSQSDTPQPPGRAPSHAPAPVRR
jgi:membrane protein